MGWEEWFEARKKELKYVLLLVAALLGLTGEISATIVYGLSATLFWVGIFIERIPIRVSFLAIFVLFGIHILLGESFVTKSDISSMVVFCLVELSKVVKRRGYRIE
jgi:hypothetical protein